MRAKNMQKLTDQVKAARPGVVVYGIGDAAHQKQSSDHNEDDTPGVRTPQTDADNVKEHRAVDVMLGSNFSRNDGNLLVQSLVTDPTNRGRVSLVIFDGFEYSARTNFRKVARTSDKHPDHVHVSGAASDDDNDAPWNLDFDASVPPQAEQPLDVDGELGPKTVTKWQKVMGTTVDGKIDADDSQLVRAVQEKLKATVNHRLVVDGQGIYQNGKFYKTVAALQQYLGSPVDGRLSVPKSQAVKALQRRLNENRF
jgi:hypothetical protein